ncbi:MAG TPA: helix-turn-helix transcriptional regulator [Bradyrhizobium sp.]|uniref:S24 family peptidase n=1 Tax=Bradyrhizobium sp. TaxID=376 RepID=UPI002CCB812F|nr:helix-turn-helix transcriptional regulator [Bradyrhizobium sp.]HLZ06289.1 helix-turn-helix transcriptional regulator [Bradyrhizobium sp.]
MARHAKTPRILTHEQIWTALDRLAARASLSPSGLARRAGLDATTFNKSKRVTPDGRERWPSTESIAKALAAADTSIDTFVQLIGDGPRPAASVSLLTLAQAAQRGHFDEHGHLAGKGFDKLTLPSADDEHAFALEISGSLHEPAYRDGDVVLVSPSTAIRRGDRVVVKTSGGEVLLGELKRRTAKVLELAAFGAAGGDRALAAGEVEWIARIVWVRQ